MVAKKRYDKRNEWSARYRKDVGLWIPHLKRTYLYWFKYLQLAHNEGMKIDWKKYKGWGGENAIIGMKFDDWWESHWKDLFGVKDPKDKPKFEVSTKRPDNDAIRYALRIYENRWRGSNWEVAIWLKKNEKRMYFLEFFGMIDENMKTQSRLQYVEQDQRVYSEWGRNEVEIIRRNKSDNVEMDTDWEAYLNRDKKRHVQSKVGRYKRYAERYLKNVCEGKFP